MPRLLWWIAVLAVIGGIIRIVATYDIFSVTFDEPAHIAAGMQLLDKGKFTYEPLHPPLARIAVALGPYLAGYRSQNGGDIWDEGNRLLASSPDGRPSLLTLARLGVLPFFLLSLIVTWWWTTRYIGATAAACAIILLGNLPVLLGHAGLATTDVVFTATFLMAFFSFLFWLEDQSVGRGAMLGVAVGLSLTAKLSTLLFFPAACGAVLIHRWVCERETWPPLKLLKSWPSGLAGIGTLVVTVWAVYGCNSYPFYGILDLVNGIDQLLIFADSGDWSYFLGEIRPRGTWAFFPVLILIKSPIPLLVAFAVGAVTMCRNRWRDWCSMAPLLGTVAIVTSVLPSTINIGLRHILPIFPLMAIVAGTGVAQLLATPILSPRALIAALLLIWQVGDAAVAGPDYLAYFNEFAMGQPQRIVVGSDLDWGQDINRLAAALRERNVLTVYLALHTSADLRNDGLPFFKTLIPGHPTKGWIAISEQMRVYYCRGYRWLDSYKPNAKIGTSIRLYHITNLRPEHLSLRRNDDVNWDVPQPCPSTD